MASIKCAYRSALVAFSRDAPYLVSGTMAGAVDLSFSSSASLEIFKIDLASDAPELPVVGECAATERFNRLSWGEKPGSTSEEFALGLVAGGLVDGSIGLWNPAKLTSIEGIKDDPLISRHQKHTGPVRGLEFNSNSPNLLASGADSGELCIWDLSDPKEPTVFPPLSNAGSGLQGEVSFLSWNHKVHHILASTSYTGTTVIWDLRRQKPVISFHDPDRRRCSVLQWHPDNATHLIVASDEDSKPTMSFWDVRNTLSPIKEFVGHTKGVLAMSWCPHDSSFLLTCGKDNRTICWDIITAEIISELPSSTNWNFDVHWCPKIPGVVSASSFDGKISIYNIEACPKFGDLAGTLSHSASSRVHFRASKWLKRPVGVSFGFGGKLVLFHSSPSATSSEVYLHNVVIEPSMVNRSSEFETAVKSGDRCALRMLCEKKCQDSESDSDRETWNFLKVMFEEEGAARTKLLGHLGFSVPLSETTEYGQGQRVEMDNVLSLDDNTSKLEATGVTVGNLDNGEDFFNSLASPKANPCLLSSETDIIAEGGKVPMGDQALEDAGESSSFDECIQRALVVGDYKGAVLQCVSANRMADALVIAHLGGSSLWESTRDQYLKKSHSSYLKVVSSMVRNDFMGLVKTRPLNCWKETLALLCSFAQGEEWTGLCDTLASRLMTAGNLLAATLCYICAGNIDKTMEIWSRNLMSTHGGRTYFGLLQDLMEKTVTLALATGQKHFSLSLSKLVEKYAELLANEGLITAAMVYLSFLAIDESSPELAILRDRVTFYAEENEPSKSISGDSTQFTSSDNTQFSHAYGAKQPGLSMAESSHHYYQDKVQSQLQTVSGSPYREIYHHANTVPLMQSGGYPSKPQASDFVGASTGQPSALTSHAPNIFLPSQTANHSQASFAPPPITAQPAIKPFVPSTPAALKNVEQYQQPTLGGHLHPGTSALSYQPTSAGPGSFTTGSSSQVVSSPSFRPIFSQGSFGPGPVSQITSTAGHTSTQPQVVAAAPPPPPNIHSVDTSSVSERLKPVIRTLTMLYNETSEALGGAGANIARKREIEDNSRRLGSLFAKMNSGDLSSSAVDKLIPLCQALDRKDFVAALNFQVQLTTSEWDECNFWLTPLKRMIKTRQNARF